jgi:probable rRNA maturation factor
VTIEIDILIAADDWDAVDDLDPLTRACIAATLAETGVGLIDGCEVSLNFCDDAEIRALNDRWRGKDSPTNVLSFPTPGPTEAKALLGDIVIAFETVAHEAREQDKPFRDHIRHMIVHGFLHLLGYNHETREEAEEMEALERRIAASLGMNDPYATAEDPGAHKPDTLHVDTI